MVDVRCYIVVYFVNWHCNQWVFEGEGWVFLFALEPYLVEALAGDASAKVGVELESVEFISFI